MFCKNCGSRLHSGAAVCVRCGCARGAGRARCSHCGHRVHTGASVCTHCGMALYPYYTHPQAKSKLAAGLLGIFLGGWGIHNFYLGYTNKAVTQLLITLLGSIVVIGPLVAGVWGLVDGIMILNGQIPTDANGILLKD